MEPNPKSPLSRVPSDEGRQSADLATKTRALTLDIPEASYQVLERFAWAVGKTPKTVGTACLIEAIERLPIFPDSGQPGPAPPPSTVRATAPAISTAPHARSAPRAATATDGLRIVWEGPQMELHSFAKVNRELCLRLIDRGHELSLIPSVVGGHAERPFPRQAVLEGRIHQPLGRPITAHVRHQWPPMLLPPPDGYWVMVQPWEYGSLPRSWIGPMDLVDEIWAYTEFVRDSFISSGVSPDRVHVIPLGVDPGRFHPGATPYSIPTTKPFKFVFVGGTIHRKGIDLLLNAYTETFTARDPVCLVIKDAGGNTFYRGQTAATRIGQIQTQPLAPEIQYIDQDLSDDELAGLYTACDCLVHPYRGEGFGLPIAEAMACGLPVIVTAHGAALDYCSDENAFLVPARILRFRNKKIGDLETVDFPSLAEPDTDRLRNLMRFVVDRPDDARSKGAIASAQIRGRFTWDATVDKIETRLWQLRLRPIRRSMTLRDAAKAGLAPTSPPHATGRGPVVVTSTHREWVSLCMIVKNEEAHLAACLGSVADMVDEMIVVDTGSTDATAAVAARSGAQVYPFQWVDNFAAARNESLRHARGKWVFWLDGDEILDDTNRRKLRSLLAGLRDENAAYIMRQRSPVSPGAVAAVVVDQVRLFRRLPDVRWSYRVHEQILPALRRTGVSLRRSDVEIGHTGHEDVGMRRRKLDRDLRLLLMEHAEQPDDPFTLFNLGALYDESDRSAEALPLLRRSLERSKPRASIVPKLHALITGCLRKLGQAREALDACQAGRSNAPDDVELLFLEGLLQRELGDRAGAEAIFLRLLSKSRDVGFANGDDGLRGYKARHNLAVICEESGRAAEAETHWRAAVVENPLFTPGWLQLGELCLKQRRWDDLEEAARGLAACPAGDAKAIALRDRGLATRHGLARQQSARPRVSLCMIVKNEEAALAACLASVADLVDEMIVVDTGSTDRTRDLAVQGGARVIEVPWLDDFAAARNESISHATGDWIFWLDADERLDEANREKLRAVFSALKWENCAYLMRQLSATDDPHGSQVVVDQVRLFRRNPALRWEYRVHEQILLAVRRAGHDLRRTEVVIDHGGFQAPGSSERKLQRNLALLLRQDADRPDDPITLYQLGLVYQRLARAADAMPILRRSLELMPSDFSIRPRLYTAIARAHESMGQKVEALAVSSAGLRECPDADELLFLEASLLHDGGDEAGAEERLLRLLRMPPGQQLAAGDAGRRGYKARHLLAEVYRCQNRPAEAEAQWRLVVTEQPRFAPAWQRLSELCSARKQWTEPAGPGKG